MNLRSRHSLQYERLQNHQRLVADFGWGGKRWRIYEAIVPHSYLIIQLSAGSVYHLCLLEALSEQRLEAASEVLQAQAVCFDNALRRELVPLMVK